ncbi:MAG TPA: hypothetical protein VGG39_36685 [Polyangiaceae bacterium]
MDAFTSSGNYLGTDRIGRALTDEESKRLGRMLRDHGFVGASMVALRFGFRLTRGRGNARDLFGRVQLRLVRTGWDPNAVPLVKRLCRLVWSEYTHEVRESDTARRAEESFLREEGILGEPRQASAARGDPVKPAPLEPVTSSYEQQLERLAAERDDEARRALSLAQLRRGLPVLRARLRANEDVVNEAWVECHLRGVRDLDAMVKEKGHTKDEFYAAQKRRQRAVQDVLEETRPAAPHDEEKD